MRPDAEITVLQAMDEVPFPMPTARSCETVEAAVAALRERNSELSFIGAGNGLNADFLNDQILQGLALTRLDRSSEGWKGPDAHASAA